MSDAAAAETAGKRPQRSAPRYVLVYDGSCKVCSNFVLRLARWDRAGILDIVPSQAPGIAQRFPWIQARAFDESVQLIRLADGRTWQGAAAIEELLGVLPKGRAAAWLFRIPFIRRFSDRFYRWFARNRYRIG